MNWGRYVDYGVEKARMVVETRGSDSMARRTGQGRVAP